MINWEAVGAIAELVGAAAVILTLFYLARQIKHASDQVRLGAVQAIGEANDRAFDPIYTPEMMSIWTRGHADREGLREDERQIFDLLMVRIFASYDNSVFQNEHGIFDQERLQMLTRFYAGLLDTSGGASWFDAHLVEFSRRTMELLEGARNARGLKP